MGRAFRYLITYLAGGCTGLLAAQALVATVARNGGSPGGELLIVPAIPLLLWCGYTFGRDARQFRAYHNGYKHGRQAAQRDREGGHADGKSCTTAQ